MELYQYIIIVAVLLIIAFAIIKMNKKDVKLEFNKLVDLLGGKDNILDTRSVNGKDANSYELRIYIHDTNEDWYNKHYHYRVVLKKVI